MDTQNNTKRYTLRQKLLNRSLLGFAGAVMLYILLSKVFYLFIQDYLTFSSYIQYCEKNYLEQFQNYITAEQICTTDCEKIRYWTKEKDISILSIARENVLLYDNTYVGYAPLKNSESIQFRENWIYSTSIIFSDGPADVYLSKDFAAPLYILMSVLAMFFAAIFWIIVFLLGIRRDIQYILLLQKEVFEMSSIQLNSPFTIQGNNEITDLAFAMEQMRQKILEDTLQQSKMIEERENLTLGLAHDLRTPLTGLYGYLEVIKIVPDIPLPAKNYVEQAMRKATEIKDMADQLFECFLANNKELCELEAPESPRYHLEDYLSDFCVQLEISGFHADISGLSWNACHIQVNYDFISRILNNLLSNITKYASSAQPIHLVSIQEDGYWCICIKNDIGVYPPTIKGTHIGVPNIHSMMQKMGGNAQVNKEASSYTTTLRFPIAM